MNFGFRSAIALCFGLALFGSVLGCQGSASAGDRPTTAVHTSPSAPAAGPNGATPSSSPTPEQPPVVPTAQPAKPGEVAAFSKESEPPTLYIRPLGNRVSSSDVDFVKNSLQAFYSIKLSVSEPAPLPEAAYYPPRQRYRAEKLLDTLKAELPQGGFRVLGLTGHDISTTKPPHEDWGVLGLATLDGVACVISSFRARRGAKSDEHARVRLAKTAVHEIGHTLGLEHCESTGCLMRDARGTVTSTDSEYDLCEDCRAQLRTKGYALTTDQAIPWQRP